MPCLPPPVALPPATAGILVFAGFIFGAIAYLVGDEGVQPFQWHTDFFAMTPGGNPRLGLSGASVVSFAVGFIILAVR